MRAVGAVRRADAAAALVTLVCDDASSHRVGSPDSTGGAGAGEDRTGSGPGRSWWSWLAVAAAALLVAAVVVQGRAPSATPALPAPHVASAVAHSPGPTAPLAPPAVLDLGHRLLAAPANWDLFGRGPGVLVRIQLAPGRLTVTPLPGDSGSTPAGLLAFPGRVVIRPTTSGVGYVVADGTAAARLLGPLGQAGPAFPGPRPDQVWIRTSPATQDTTLMTLMTGPDGRAGDSVLVPGDAHLAGDGTGHVMYTTRADNVSFLTSPGRWQIQTPGQILAAGSHEVVTAERDRAGRQITVLTEVPGGHRRVLAAGAAPANPTLGTIAPGGRAAAIVSSGPTVTTLTVLDLGTGRTRGHPIALAGNTESAAWSPDGRWLFAATPSGVLVVDAGTGVARDLGVTLPPLTQLVVRATAKS